MMETTFKMMILSKYRLLAIVQASTEVKPWLENSFWIERNDARMPVWVRVNTESGPFIVFNLASAGSCGTAQSLFAVTPANSRFDRTSPLQALKNVTRGDDVLLMQTIIKAFINQTLMLKR